VKRFYLILYSIALETLLFLLPRLKTVKHENTQLKLIILIIEKT